MTDFDILKSMADLNNFIQRQQASMLQLYQFDYEQKKKEAKDKLINKIVNEKKDPIDAAQEVDKEYQDYNFGNDLLVTGLTVKKMMPANTFAEINRIDKDKPVYMADNGYATERDAYSNYTPLEYNYDLMFYKETNNAIKWVQVTFNGGVKGSFMNDVQANIKYNGGNPIVSISVKDGDQVKVHEFKDIHKNPLQDRIAKELQINNPYMIQKIVEGIGAGLEKLNNGDKPLGYYGSGNKDVKLGNENVSLPPTDGVDSQIDLSSNFNNLLISLFYMDNAEYSNLLKAHKFVLKESTVDKGSNKYKKVWFEIYQKEDNIVKQTIEKIGNKALLTAAHIFETRELTKAIIKKGDKEEEHFVLNIGTTEDEFVINGGETKTVVSGNQVYRRVLGSSIDNGMPIVIYYTKVGDEIKNIVGARMYLSANEKQHIDQLSNHIMNNGPVNADFADFLNRFKKSLTDLTIIGAYAFATNKYHTSSKEDVGNITLKEGTIELGSEESLWNNKKHIALIANYDPNLTKSILSILQRSTRLKNIGDMIR